MTPDRWEQIGELYKEALELRPAERLTFLDRACKGDEALQREVESLLAANEGAEDFMIAGALDDAAKLLVDDEAPWLVGKRLGRYEILSLLGTGGMGEVYLARDTKLKREVAIKVLPVPFSMDTDRLRRFEREASAASSLNHPNILTVHEVGSENDLHFIATEYVAGETLRQRMTRAPMELREVLDICIQVGSALAAAHGAGIVHRDIKPGNVMVRPDGYVKVLDFGLAKMTQEVERSVVSHNLQQANTETGRVLGTAQYMSPEQALGREVDQRTDIFSLGVLMYEMATGKLPFTGSTAAAGFDELLHKAPTSPMRLNPKLPVELEKVINKALHKDRELRYQSASDLLIDLKRVKRNADGAERDTLSLATFVHARQRWRASRFLWLAPVVAFVIGGAVLLRFLRATSESTLLPTRVTLFTSFPGEELTPAFSPDGKQIAFAWNGVQGDNFDIYVKLIDTGAPLRLTTHPGSDYGPAFSPDGRFVAFTRSAEGENGIFTVPALGGPERKLLSFNFAIEWFGLHPHVVWSPDGRFIAFPYKKSLQDIPGIFLLSLETLEESRLTEPPAGYIGDWSPTFSPDGETLAFTRWTSEGATDIYLIATHGGEPGRLTFDNTWINGLDWTADSKNVAFLSARGGSFNFWRISPSGGPPERLGVGGSADTAFLFASPISVSRQGHNLAYAQSLVDANIWRVEIQNAGAGRASPTKLITSTRYDSGPQFSPDGKRIVFQSDRSGMDEVWVCDADGSNPRQLSFFGGPMAGTPRWSPDGQKIAFDARAEGNSDIYTVSPEGGKPRRITTEKSGDVVPSWSRDGRWVYFASNRTGDWQVWKAPTEGGVPVQVTKRGGFAAFESPAGEFIYYAKFSDSGLWRIPVAGGEESLILDELKAGYWGSWAVIKEGLYFVNPERKPRATIEFFNFATGRVSQIATLEKEPTKGIAGFAVSPDGRSILYSQLDQEGSDIILVENFR